MVQFISGVHLISGPYGGKPHGGKSHDGKPHGGKPHGGKPHGPVCYWSPLGIWTT